jgi:peptide/nickel transport system ATP-binding protein
LKSIPKIGPERYRLDPIRGMVPSPFQKLTGCPFHPRCDSMVKGLCDKVAPNTIALSENHKVRCLLYDDMYKNETMIEEAAHE